MADVTNFVVPKGKLFSFTVRVIEKDSFIAQDLTDIDLVNSSFALLTAKDGAAVSDTGFPITLVVTDALNGILTVTMPAAYTATLLIDRGSKEDSYYLKALYQGVIDVRFIDATPPMVAIVGEVFVTPTGTGL